VSVEMEICCPPRRMSRCPSALVASNGLQLALEVVFGPTDFRNEVTWKRPDHPTRGPRERSCHTDHS